jgi:pimeloyl-ACP methyl ester carboxylesterase
MTTTGIRLLLVAAALSLASPVWARSQFCTSATNCRGSLNLSTGGSIPYYRSLPLVRNDLIHRAVIVVHGNQRDADRYYDSTVASAIAAQRVRDVVVLAPNFRTVGDHPAPGEHYWSSQGWKTGDKSRDAGRISSFSVIDELLARVCPKTPGVFPNLATVVIIGHSAGGQFVSRYAAGGAGCPNHAVEVRYVVMNPSSYLYVDGRRKSAATPGFGRGTAGCQNYDEYKYGLNDLNSYMKRVGIARLRTQLFTRRTYYLAGTNDVGKGGSLDTRCEANLQGPNRLVRFENYREYKSMFKEWTGAVFILVPGVGHDGGKMLASDIARRIMFR